MEQFKFIVSSVIALALVGLLGYWAVTTIQSGSEHKNTEKIKVLTDENENLKKEVAKLNDQVALLAPQASGETSVAVPAKQAPAQEPKTPPEKPAATAYKNQALINELQKLIDSNIYMKLKSNGSRVGTIQKFLNIYNKTSNKIDNDYGASLKTSVAAFQKSQGLTADGEAGPGTFKKMIGWLKKQG
jgi:murein L,D-transpeptidase YcbB/YkuD